MEALKFCVVPAIDVRIIDRAVASAPCLHWQSSLGSFYYQFAKVGQLLWYILV
jgi:hypothetical protein